MKIEVEVPKHALLSAALQEESPTQEIDLGPCIVIADRGWMFAGRCTELAKTRDVRITDGFNIERWGTTEGIGELQTSGPTDKTRLRKVGTVTVRSASVVSVLPIERFEKWVS